MKFGKRHSQMTVVMAMVHGVVIGMLAIVVVGVIFISAEGKRPVDKIEKEIPTAGPGQEEADEVNREAPTDRLTLYAKQHGAFTSSAAAATFLAEDSSLSTAAIIPGDEQYFVWSAVGKSEAEIEALLDEETYKKTVIIEAIACETNQAEKLWEVFQLEDVTKIKKSISEGDGKTDAFMKKIDAITAFTSDLNVIRLHLLSKYVTDDQCLKISF